MRRHSSTARCCPLTVRFTRDSAHRTSVKNNIRGISMDLNLSGKTAIITGGSGGIGRGLVLEFAREGINVVSASRDATTGQQLADEAQQMGLRGKILAIKTDVTQRASVDAMIAQANAEFGPIDIL